MGDEAVAEEELPRGRSAVGLSFLESLSFMESLSFLRPPMRCGSPSAA